MKRLPHRLVEPLTPGVRAEPAAPQQHGGRRPLDESHQLIVAAPERRHHLAGARERQDAPVRQVAARRGQSDRRRASASKMAASTGLLKPWCAPSATCTWGCDACCGNFEHARRGRRPPARCGVLTAEFPGGRPDSHDRHLPGGQRPCLVGADDGGGAQGLDGRKAAHERMPSRHAAHADRQRDGGDGG